MCDYCATYVVRDTNINNRDVTGGPVIKHPPANAGNTGPTPGLGRFRVPWGNSSKTYRDLKTVCTEDFSFF